MFDTNVLGPAHLTRLVSDEMIAGRVEGSIIFVTSIHQWVVWSNPVYSSSKAALDMVVKEYAVALAPHLIRVNGIAPGYVAEDDCGRPLPHEPTLLRKTSINPAYVARAAVYLAADHFSRFTTGTILKLDAGLSLRNHLV